MLNFEEELAKFKPSRDIDHVGDTIVNRDITDVTDIMVEFMKEQYGQYEEEDHREQEAVWSVYIVIISSETGISVMSAGMM